LPARKNSRNKAHGILIPAQFVRAGRAAGHEQGVVVTGGDLTEGLRAGPGRAPITSTSAPASRTAFLGSVNSACSLCTVIRDVNARTTPGHGA
jgi:hypothetical protein